MAKRVALLLPSLDGGGAERSALFVGRTLERRGYASDIVVAERKGPLLNDAFARDHLIVLGAWPAVLSVRQYRRYLRDHRPDLVISFVHTANLLSGIGGWLEPSVPFVVSIRNTLGKLPRDQWWPRRWFGFALERRLYRRAALVQTISRALAGECRDLLGVPRERLWNTYSTATEDRGPPRMPTDRAEIDSYRPFIVSAARLVPSKGFALLIRAFARARIDPALKLLIVGKGPERARLEALIAALGVGRRVRLIGYRDPLTPWLDAARGFVFASRGEGLSRVTLEALAAGLPIAASRCPGVTELIEDGFGRLIDMHDEAGFARAIEDIASGALPPPDPARLADHLRAFSPEAVGRSYVAMVERCIGAP